jgi:hypothetical protein
MNLPEGLSKDRKSNLNRSIIGIGIWLMLRTPDHCHHSSFVTAEFPWLQSLPDSVQHLDANTEPASKVGYSGATPYRMK